MKRSRQFEAFDKLVGHVLSVPHSVIKERIEEHKRQSAKNPKKRGPKKKPNISKLRNP